jgi:hypothetical protein
VVPAPWTMAAGGAGHLDITSVTAAVQGSTLTITWRGAAAFPKERIGTDTELYSVAIGYSDSEVWDFWIFTRANVWDAKVQYLGGGPFASIEVGEDPPLSGNELTQRFPLSWEEALSLGNKVSPPPPSVSNWTVWRSSVGDSYGNVDYIPDKDSPNSLSKWASW